MPLGECGYSMIEVLSAKQVVVVQSMLPSYFVFCTHTLEQNTFAHCSTS